MYAEIRVHVKAASRVADDRRYVAIAQGTIDFKPVNITRITSCNNTIVSNEQESPPGTAQILSGTAVRDPTQSPKEKATVVPKPISASSSHGKIRGSYEVSKTPLATRLSHVQRKVRNPPYRSPLRQRSIESASFGHTCAIASEITSLRSAEPNAYVLVPNTEQPTRKRNFSEAFLAQSDFTAISDSQRIGSADQSSSSRSSWSRSFHSLISVAREQRSSCCGIEPTTGPVHSSAVRTITVADTTLSNTDQQVIEIVPAIKSHGPEKAISRSDVSCSADSVLPRIERECKSIHGLSDDRPAIEEDASTVTVSPQSQAFRGHLVGGSNILQSMAKISPIDLITPQCSATNIKHETDSEIPKSAAPPLQSNSTENLNASVANLGRLPGFAAIRALPILINGPNPSVKQFYQPAYQQPVLKATAEALTLPRHFKPETMTRKVSGKERGYWKIPFRIVTSAQANRERPLALDHIQSAASPGWRPLLKHDSLTEPEFLAIWEDMNRFISSGNIGWSVKVIRRAFLITPNQNPDSTVLNFHLQVFCYGEAIPHIYAMLLVCTRMYVLCHPVEWISTVDDEPVVVMTGDELRRGHLGPWTCGTDQQGKEFWRCSMEAR